MIIPSTGSFILGPTYKVNDAHDVHSNLGNRNMVGYEQMVAMYHRYHVIKAQVDVTFWNQSTTEPCQVYVFFGGSKYLQGGTTAEVVHQMRDGYPYGWRSKTLSVLGSGLEKCRIKSTYRLGSLIANPASYNIDEGYRARGNASPGFIVGAQLCATTLSAGAAVANIPIIFHSKVTLWVKFYDRNDPLPLTVDDNDAEDLTIPITQWNEAIPTAMP